MSGAGLSPGHGRTLNIQSREGRVERFTVRGQTARVQIPAPPPHTQSRPLCASVSPCRKQLTVGD